MAVHIKTPQEIEKMRLAGQLAADVLEMITPHVQVGVTTEELDKLVHDYVVEEQKAYPASLGYHGFPKSMCTSVNHVVCHGIPNHRKLKDGDILNIDVIVEKNGYHGDTSKMFLLGEPSIKAQRLVRITHEALWLGINMVRPGVRLGDIGAAIQQFVENNNYSVVREYCGHGVGSVIHEADIQMLHYGKAGTGLVLESGMTFTIEPMVNAGKRHIKTLPDQWTVVTKDRQLSAQWEHTLLVTEDGVEVLTLRNEEKTA